MWKIFVPHCLQHCLFGLIMNVVSTPLHPGTICPTVPLAGEEAARVVSTQEHVVTIPLPSRVQVLFSIACFTSSLIMVRTFTFTKFLINSGIELWHGCSSHCCICCWLYHHAVVFYVNKLFLSVHWGQGWLIVTSQALQFSAGTMTSGQTLHTAPILATLWMHAWRDQDHISTVGGQIPTAFTQISVHFLLTFVLQLQLMMFCCPGSFQWALRQTGWKHSQCNVMHSLKGTCEQNSLTAHWSETWPNKSSSLHIIHKGNKHTSWDKFRFQTKKHHRLTSVVMSHGLWTEPVSHYLTVLMIIWRRTKKRSIANKKKGNEDHSTLSTVLSCRYQRGISSSNNPDLHFIVALLIWVTIVFIEIAKFILLSTKFHICICSLSGSGYSAIKLSPISCLTTLCWSLSSSTASPLQWRGLALTPPARWVSKGLISFHLSDRCRCLIYPTNELCYHCNSSVYWC